MHKICFVKFLDVNNYEDTDWESVVNMAKDWEEVDEETYNLLKAGEHFIRRKYGIHILERLTSKDTIVINSIQAYLDEVERLRILDAEVKRKKEEAALERKIKKQAKNKEEKLKLLAKLKAELKGEDDEDN